MDSREQAIREYFRVLDLAKKIEPDLKHHSKKSIYDGNFIYIHKGDAIVIKVEDEDEVELYRSATQRLQARIENGRS